MSSTEIATEFEFCTARQPAVVQDYNYSVALKNLHRTRTPTALDACLADPRRDIHGVRNGYFNRLPPEPQQDRTGVIAYLESLQTN